MRSLTLALALFGLVGCSCGGAPGAGPAPLPPPPAPPAAYEVHEWGLLRAEPGDALRAGAIAPPVVLEPLAVDKPVLYFHADAALVLRSALVSAPPGASIVETWPALAAGTSARWDGVSLSPGGACTPSPLPTASEPPCAGLPAGDQCESTGLAVVRTSDAACVTVGATTERFLFYRGRATAMTPPLVFERAGSSGDVRVTNESGDAIPGQLVRLWSSGGRTRTLAVAPPAPHASIVVHTDFPDATATADDQPPPVQDHSTLPSNVAPARDAIRATMLGLGLTASEVDAFLAAWSDTLLGRDGTMDVDSLGADAPRAPTESFVYFLPAPATEGVARLAFDPPPRAVHRALAVWSRLRASGASH